MDPLHYSDRLNAAVVEALQGVGQEIGALRQEWAATSASMASYQRVTMDSAQRIIGLEKEMRDLEANSRESRRLATESASRRRTDARVYLAIQAGIGGALAGALIAVAVALWRIASIVEVIAR